MANTIFTGGIDEVLEFFTIFENEEGERILVPDSLYSDFRDSCWFNSFNIEVDYEETI